MLNLNLILHHVFVSAGRDRLHLLLQNPHECPGPAGTAGQPVAHRQQHHRLPPPPHPLRSLLPAGPAGAAPSSAPPAQPPQWAAPAGPQVVQPENAPPFKHCPTPISTFIQDPVQFTDHVKSPAPSSPYPPTLRHTHPKGVKYLPPFVLHTVNVLFHIFILPIKRLYTKCWAWDEV